MRSIKVFTYFNLNILIIFILLSTLVYSQNPPCRKSTTRLSFTSSQLIHVPDLSISMSYNQLQSYLWIDSVCKYVNYYSFDNFLSFQTLDSNSFKKIIKYIYNFWDYNFIHSYSTFLNSSYYNDDQSNPNNPIAIYNLERLIDQKLKELNGPPYDLLTLIKSGIIAHIKVDSTVKRYIVDAKREQLIVFAHVLDTIKGKILPSLKNIDLHQDTNNYKDPIPWEQTCLPSSKFQFAYWLDDMRQCPDLRPLTDSLGNPWTSAGNEYLVFLFPNSVCFDSLNIYYYLTVFGYSSCTFQMFPIKNGMVINPLNEFGISDGSSIENFKMKLRNLINQIQNEQSLDLRLTNVPFSNNSVNSIQWLNCDQSISTDKISLTYYISNPNIKQVELIFYNFFGTIINRIIIANIHYNSINALDFNIQNFNSGIYFVQMNSSMNSSFIKFIKY